MSNSEFDNLVKQILTAVQSLSPDLEAMARIAWRQEGCQGLGVLAKELLLGIDMPELERNALQELVRLCSSLDADIKATIGEGK